MLGIFLATKHSLLAISSAKGLPYAKEYGLIELFSKLEEEQIPFKPITQKLKSISTWMDEASNGPTEKTPNILDVMEFYPTVLSLRDTAAKEIELLG